MKSSRRSIGLALALLLALAPGAWAQITAGNIYGTVSDESGAVLPGATVTLSGDLTGARTTTSGSQGDFRFVNLDPGTYKVTVTLTGFSSVAREVAVNTGFNVNLTFGLKVATVEETVTVTAETPVVDTKKIGTQTNVGKEELEKTPNARDPWAILRTIPGILVDRVNIAGNESGQQANFAGKGAQNVDTMWNYDGISITDMSATGASPSYYDFDAFEEISVSTGGQDVRVATGGIALNFVTKRGTNNFHGSLRGYFTHDDLSQSNLPDELANDPRLVLPDGTRSDKADHIDQIADYGLDVGGPIMKDKLWFWASYAKQDIRLVRTNQTKDKTILEDYNAKVNWQATANDMVTVSYFKGDKTKLGRSGLAAAFGLQEDEFGLWDQGGLAPGWLPANSLLKAEINHVFGPTFVVNAKYGYFGSGFELVDRGRPMVFDFVNGVGTGAYTYGTLRPQHTVNVDASYFFGSAGGNHELKFGFGYRRYPVESNTSLPGDKVWTRLFGPSSGYALVTRDRVSKYLAEYSSAYLGDTFTRGRFTLNAGVRFDLQKSKNQPSVAPANPIFPNLLPALNFSGGGQGAEWKDVSPRVGVTYALDESRKTVVRASYARYAGQLGAAAGAYDAFPYISYLAYYWEDTNGNRIADPSEVLTDLGVVYAGYVNPGNPADETAIPNRIDPDYEANHDNEFIVGIDRELMANFAASAAFTYRRSTDLTWFPRIGMTTADYTPNAPATANGFTARTFSPDPSGVAASNNGFVESNRPDSHLEYKGLELSLNKRLSNKWMGRLALSYNDWTEHIDGAGAIVNPSRTQQGLPAVAGSSGPNDDGGQVAPRSGGSGKGDIFYNAKWQVTATALYQLPAGFEVSGSVFGRQGYPRPIILRLPAGADGRIRVLATDHIDDVRYPDIWNLDLRLAKNLKFGENVTATLIADAFNVLNRNTELNRQRQANASSFDRLDEVLSPQVFRFGVRLGF